MKRIPGGREVDQAFLTTIREVKTALKQLNQQAAKLLSKGDYGGAEALVNLGRSINEFQSEVETLRHKWKELRTIEKVKASQPNDTTPLWEYYQPILQTLVALDGEARSDEILRGLEKTLKGKLKPGDTTLNSRGIPKWKVMIKRARRPMIREGFLENSQGMRWKISTEGRRMIERARTSGSSLQNP